ncbi:zf-HC2 domain-containing protein [Planococcus shenhongbingii]|uniref:anti-sigma factor family protein n=1 Tax=Planococcus shenhongbingii TaxID=3058398 RepID=UPI00260DCCC1|nr:zf-HC2 domain-containing protein [Planococcus sp. N016]WKA57035.1 zf-HC2 domain-containing protein [Planococcus sp. N016]
MTCHDLGVLQAYLDGEVSREQKKQIMKHLESCHTCREKIDELQKLQSFCEKALEAQDIHIDITQAWAKFEENLQFAGNQNPEQEKVMKKRKGWSTLKTKTKRLLVSGVVAAALFSSFAHPQVRVEANQFLSLFRVNQFEVVTLTQNDISEIENWVSENKEGSLDLKGIGQLEMSEAAGETTYFETQQAAEAAGHSVPALREVEVEGVSVMPASTITFTLDVEKANQLLAQLGSDQQFEAQLDGKPFSVSTYEAVHADYVMDGQYISYMRTKSPEIDVPEGVSIEQLRATLLSLPFLPENVKTQLAGIDNIETTLPIPYAATEGSSMTEVRVGDAQGFAVESEEHSYIVWQANGDIHTIFAEGKLGTDELVGLSEQVN